MQILLVEDEDLDVTAFQRAIRKNQFSFDVTVARHGEEALDVLHSHPCPIDYSKPFLILLDINMPRMNGIEFLENFRADERFRNFPVAVLTTSDEGEDISSAYRLGISAYILKQNAGEGLSELMRWIDSYCTINLFPRLDLE